MSTPSLTTTWAGVTQSQAGGWYPPDNNLAAGTSNIITVVNDHIDIYLKTGTSLYAQSLNTFFNQSASSFIFDPRVMWDQYANRFIVIADDQTGSNSVVHLAVSKDSNPLDGWYNYDFNVKNGNSWFDYPVLGLDASTIYFSGNYFSLSTGNYTSSGFWAIDKTAVESNQAVTAHLYNPATLGAPFTDLYTPAHLYGSEAGLSGDFLVEYAQNNSGNDTLRVLRVANAGTGTISSNIQSLNLGNISDASPVGGRQPGTSTLIDTGDDRIQDAIWSNNKLYAVTEIRVGSGSSAHDVVHWFVVDTSNLNSLSLVGQGNVDFGANYDTSYGNLTVDSSGNMIIGYSVSGSNVYGSSAYTVISAGGTAVQDASPVYLHQGEGIYDQGRWGDYSGVSIDPTDNNSFWLFNQYATSSDSWATTIGAYQINTETLFQQPVFVLTKFGTADGWSSDNSYPREVADVNGDGMADIVGFGSQGVYVSLATGGGHFAPYTFESTRFGTADGWSSDNSYPRELADVNGDGMDDIVGFGSQGVYVSLATGGGHFAPYTFESTRFGTADGWSSDNTYPRQLADVNGDGMDDIVGFGSQGVYVSLATGGGHFAKPTFESTKFGTDDGWSSDNSYPRQLADVNGDGKADIIGFGSQGVYVSLATGGGHFAAYTFESTKFGTADGWSSYDQFPRTVADIDGDGMADIVGFGQNGVYVSHATGGGHFSQVSFEIVKFGTADGWTSANSFPRQVADITGDGAADIVGFGINGVYVSLAHDFLV